MYDTVKALESLGSVEFLSFRTSKLVPGIHNHVPRTYGRPPKIYDPFHLWQLLNNTDCLVVKHLQSPLNLVPYVITWLRRIPLVIIVQRFSLPRSVFTRMIVRFLMIWLNRRHTHVIAVTREGFKNLQPYIRHLTYLPMATNTHRFTSSFDKGRSGGIIRLLTVSKYQRRKRLDLLLEALVDLRKQHPNQNIHLTIIGNRTNEPQNRGEFERIQHLVAKFDLTNVVTLEQAVPYEKMPSRYAAADIFVLPAEHEPLGYAVVEAMAAGLPVIISSDCGAASYVKPGTNGYIFQAGSGADISARLHQTLSQVATFGAASRQLAATEHSPTRWVTFFQNLLH